LQGNVLNEVLEVYEATPEAPESVGEPSDVSTKVCLHKVGEWEKKLSSGEREEMAAGDPQR
jgi:hypothetical protein